MNTKLNPKAIQRVAYRVGDAYAEVVERVNNLNEADREVCVRLAQHIMEPFVTASKEIEHLALDLVVEDDQ